MSPAAGVVQRIELCLPDGATVEDALRHSGLRAQAACGNAADMKVGVWGQPRPLAHRLRDGDRVEIYRPLLIDPMDARRQRQQRAKKR